VAELVDDGARVRVLRQADLELAGLGDADEPTFDVLVERVEDLDRAVVEDGQIVVRPMNYLAMSYDHRIIDGREAVLGLVAMKEALEDPARLLLDI
jgi:hypothetical protein